MNVCSLEVSFTRLGHRFLLTDLEGGSLCHILPFFGWLSMQLCCIFIKRRVSFHLRCLFSSWKTSEDLLVKRPDSQTDMQVLIVTHKVSCVSVNSWVFRVKVSDLLEWTFMSFTKKTSIKHDKSLSICSLVVELIVLLLSFTFSTSCIINHEVIFQRSWIDGLKWSVDKNGRGQLWDRIFESGN